MVGNMQVKKISGTADRILRGKFFKFDLEIKRIEKLLDETVEKLTFAMTIPQLVDDDYKLIKNHLNEKQLKKIKHVFKNCLPSEELCLSKEANNQIKLSGTQSIKKIEEYFNSYSISTENVPQSNEYDFSDAFLILYNHENIKNISERFTSSISDAGHDFIQNVKFFFYTILDKIQLTPQEVEIKEHHLRKMCLHHQEITDEAQILEQNTLKQVASKNELLQNKLSEMLAIKGKIDKILKDCQEFVMKSGYDADKQMIFDWKSSEYRQEVLQEKVNKQLIDLDYLRKKYVEEEKELRTKRFKTEQNLISFLKQYDKDMQNRQNEVDAQQETVMLEKHQLNELQEKYNEQETIYTLLMEEKADYEKRLFEAKLYELKCSIAARKIQKFYRNIRRLIHISGKRELMRGKKKKKK